MPEVRLIDANAMRNEWLEHGENEYVYDTNAVLASIDEQPTLTEYAPIVKAHWVYTPCDGALVTFCSHCGYEETGANLQKYKGCPMCRAMMTHTNRVL